MPWPPGSGSFGASPHSLAQTGHFQLSLPVRVAHCARWAKPAPSLKAGRLACFGDFGSDWLGGVLLWCDFPSKCPRRCGWRGVERSCSDCVPDWPLNRCFPSMYRG